MVKLIYFILFTLIFGFFIRADCLGIYKEKKILTAKILYIDENFSDIETDLILKAVSDWEYISNGKVRFIIYPYAKREYIKNINTEEIETLFVERVNDDNDFVISMDKKIRGQLLGYYDGVSDIHRILLVADRYNVETDMVVATTHEIGHSLKLEHIEEVFTIMYRAHDGTGTCLTYFDMYQFCNIYHCNVDTTNYCMPFYKD